MRTYWIETVLIAALFTMAMGFTLAQAQGSAVPDYVYGDKTGVVPDGVYGGNDNLNIAVTPRGTTISVQPLDAPNNPYTKQYSDIDRFIYGNMDAQYTRTQMTQSSAGSGDPTVLGRNLFNNPTGGDRRVPVLVDENGFMIPTTSPRYLTPQFVQTAPGEYTVADADLYDEDLGDFTDRDADINADDANDIDVDVAGDDSKTAAKVTPGTQGNAKVAVKGATATRHGVAYSYTLPLPEDKYEQFRRIQIETAAKVLPPIPNFVEKLHPTTFSLLPNGAVLVPSGGAAGVDTVTVYSPSGEVLGEAKSMQWRKFFAKNYDDIVSQAEAKGWDVVEHNGYTVLRNRESRKIEGVFDWDGKPVELSTELQPRPYYFTPLRWDNVAPVAVQQRRVPMAGREPGAQQTTGTEHQTDNSPSADTK